MQKNTFQRDTQQLAHEMSTQVRQILQLQASATPWSWMLICGFSTLMPLLWGYFAQQIPLAIFGGLIGYFIGLSDHNGTLVHRLVVATMALSLCWGCFVLGLLVQTTFELFLLSMSALVYLLGILSGKGPMLERLLLLSAISLLIARETSALNIAVLPQISIFCAVGYLTAVVGIILTRFTLQKAPDDLLSLPQAFKQMRTLDPARHFYALTYVAAVVCALLCVHFFSIERGYWMIITVLLMMKPDRKESYHRIVQRIFGTMLGFLTGHLLLVLDMPVLGYILAAGVCAFFVPYVWNRNYWLVSFLATNLVILLLSIARQGHLDDHIAFLRIKMTLYGCALSIAAILLSRLLEQILFRPQASSKSVLK